MTIFNTVIGGGGGDEVEALALDNAKNTVEGDKVVLNKNNIEENPIPYNYVASVPVDNVFTANETLTGFVKENNNGSLKVLTTEDPNNPSPDVPDSAGFKTTINYGGQKSLDATVVGATVSSDFSLSNFAAKVDNKAYFNSPFKQFSAEDIESFEVVVVATTPGDTDGNYKWLFSLTDDSMTTLFSNINTNGSNVLEAVEYTSDGSTIVLAMPALDANVKYWYKLTYSKASGYTFSRSTNGVYYTDTVSNSNTSPLKIDGEKIVIGHSVKYKYAFHNWPGTVFMDETYIKINGEIVWSGVKKEFGTVDVSKGYFRNTLSKPSDKYVSYEGGTIAKEDMVGRSYTMYPVIARSADTGSWTSESKGYLSATDTAVVGANHKSDTPVYLWHDYSHISPAVPETINPDIVLRTDVGENNVEIVGGVTVSGNTLSGFSASNYAKLPFIFAPGNKPWVGVFKITTGSDNSDVKPFVGPSSIGNSLYLYTKSGQVFTTLSSIGDGYDIGRDVPIASVSANTTYLVKVEYTGSAYNFYTATEGGSFVLGTTITNSSPIYQDASTHPFYIGIGIGATAYVFNGSVHLDGCYLEVEGKRIWEGVSINKGSVSLQPCWKNIDGVLYEYPDGIPTTNVTDIELSGIQVNATVVGSPTINGTVVSGFSESNYLTEPIPQELMEVSTKDFELVVCFTPVYSSLGGTIFGDNDAAGNGNFWISQTDYGRTLNVSMYNPNSYALQPSPTTSITAGVKTWFKWEHSNSTGEVLSISTDGKSYTSFLNRSKYFGGFAKNKFNIGGPVFSSKPFPGTIYMDECYLKVARQTVWTGAKTSGGALLPGTNNMYATRTAKGCGLAISATAPEDTVSAAIGTVELDADGAILSYSPK